MSANEIKLQCRKCTKPDPLCPCGGQYYGPSPTSPGLTPRGEPMPQTVPELQYLLNLYGEKIEEDKEELSKLKQRINVLEQRNR